MKIRGGFVSNSSTSSFTCDLCGRTEVAGMGVSIMEYHDVCTCENFHYLCHCHVDKDLDELQEELIEAQDNLRDDGYEGDDLYNKMEEEHGTCYPEDLKYQFPERYCPICQMEKLNSNDVFKVVIDHIGSERVKNMVREALARFDTREEFDEYHKDLLEKLREIEEVVI